MHTAEHWLFRLVNPGDKGRANEAHHPGELAYLDTFDGLIPCRVLSVSPVGYLAVQITGKSRGNYQQRETLTNCPPTRVIPRAFVYGLRSRHGARVRGGYVWTNR